MAKLGGTLSAVDHALRADEHRRVALLLEAEREEWAAVCFFYSSLHTVKSSLLADPIFADPHRLAAKHPLLKSGDSRTAKHAGYMRRLPGGGREKVWGINELVQVLYPQVAKEYELLYRASLEVRYGRGLQSSLPALHRYSDAIDQQYTSGQLVA